MSLEYFQKSDIIYINRKLLLKEGQPFIEPSNLKNESSLDYLVEIVQNDFYYPSFLEKAGVYIFNINSSHIFNDGNKRTSLMVLHGFIRRNGKRFKSDIETVNIASTAESQPKQIPKTELKERGEIIQAFVEDIARSSLTKEEVIMFLEKNVE